MAGIGEAASVLAFLQLAQSLVALICKRARQAKIQEKEQKLLLDKATGLKDDLQQLFEQNGNSILNSPGLQKIDLELKSIHDALKETKASTKCCVCLPKRLTENSPFSSIMEKLDNAKDLLKTLDSALVRNVAINIAKRIPKFPTCAPSLPSDVVGFGRVKVILDFLKEKEAGIDVRVVGIYGEGGLGKTTLLNWALVELSKETNQWVMPYVEVGRDRNDEGLMNLQSSIIHQLEGSEIRLQTTRHGQTVIEQQMVKMRESNMKVCLAIDNVWKEEDLTTILPSNLGSHLPSSSCILLTTRYLSVVEELQRLCKPETLASSGTQNAENRCKFLDYDPLVLPEEDARKLFRKRASLEEGQHQELLDAVVPKCGGLPLALEVLGAHFYKKPNRSNWKESVSKMRSTGNLPETPESRILEVLQFSYERLMTETRKAFLDVVRYFRDWEWDTVRCIIGYDEIEELKNSCLLKQVNPIDNWMSDPICGDFLEPEIMSVKRVKMHDLVFMLGQSLAEQNRLRPRYGEIRRLKADAENEPQTIEGLWTKTKYSWERPEAVGVDVLEKMQSLRVFNTKIDVKCPPLRRSLRYLELDCNNGAWEISMGECAHLSVISLRRLAWDFSHAQFPVQLRQLYLHDCWGLVELPSSSFGKLVLLEVLHLHGCDRLKRLPATMGKLERLQRLEVFDAHSLELELTPSIFKDMAELKVLHFHGCPQLTISPGVNWNLQSIRNLRFKGCGKLNSIFLLPIGELSSLKILSLEDMQHLEVSPCDFAGLHGLQELSFAGCKRIKSLPETLVKLSSLESLNLSDCQSLSCLPEAVGELKALLHLDLYGCQMLQGLPQSIGDLASLQVLSLENCHGLLNLPETLGQLKMLEEIDLYCCCKLQGLPRSISEVMLLRTIRLNGCEELLELPEVFVRRPEDVSNCTKLRQLPAQLWAEIGLISSDKALEILASEYGLTGLKSDLRPPLNVIIEAVPLLTRLALEWNEETLPMEEELLAKLGKATALTKLELTDSTGGGACVCHKTLEAISGLSSLVSLELRCGAEMLELPLELCRLTWLQELRLEGVAGLQGIKPAAISSLQNLRRLKIKDCSNLEKLPDDLLTSLPHLEELELIDCGSLISFLPARRSNGFRIQRLTSPGCTSLTSLPLDVICSVSLLVVEDFGGLVSSPVEAEEEDMQGCDSASFRNCSAGFVSSFLNSSRSGVNMHRSLDRLDLREIVDLRVLPPQIQHF